MPTDPIPISLGQTIIFRASRSNVLMPGTIVSIDYTNNTAKVTLDGWNIPLQIGLGKIVEVNLSVSQSVPREEIIYVD